jgi:hypothetical protein
MLYDALKDKTAKLRFVFLQLAKCFTNDIERVNTIH